MRTAWDVIIGKPTNSYMYAGIKSINKNKSTVERGIMNEVNEFINALLQLQIEDNIPSQKLKKIS